MATRRSRIKGIANIPQRRKVEPKTNEDSPVKEQDEIKQEISNNDNKVEPPPEPSQPPATTSLQSNDLPRRRNTIKPIVNQRLFQRAKVKTDNHDQSKSKEEINPVNHVIETEPTTTSSNNNLPIQNLNEDHRNVSVNETLNTHSSINVLNNSHSETIKYGSDTESTIPPLSPTKVINRLRIKAVPRLGHRRTSMTVHGSASESEDDGKRNYNRIRTESACSSISLTNEPSTPTDVGSPQKSKEFSTIIQRKCKRTEQSRKMAEARRHFQHKFANQIPDKQKLTMMDLIFYNPISNPMSQKPKKQLLEENEEEEEEEQVFSKEEVKEEEINKDHESDEENTIPAPQIKIGANGEIVIDEKSLIIENEETKRSREEIQKSKIVDGDFDTGYGVFKREKRSKDWSKEETLRFYKALNTLGTDFTLMLELFNGRSRRELKMKFKKEERVNRSLIDKALTQPVRFDITELRKEAEEQLLLQQQKEKEKENAEIKPYNRHKPEAIPYIGRYKEKTKPEKIKNPKPPKKEKAPDMYTTLEKGISSICGSDIEEEEEAVEEERNKEVTEFITKPTRSGRIPKHSKRFGLEDDLPIAKRRKLKDTNHTDVVEKQGYNNLNNMSALQPGSIMIVASETPTGEPTFKVFMVTPTQNKIPITLTEDVLNNLTQGQNNENVTVSEDVNGMASTSLEPPVSDEAIEQEMCPYEPCNISVPTDENIDLPKDGNNVTLCSDGKYDVNLYELALDEKEEFILPD